MYTKVFRQIYDGTLADNWQALVTFQQLLVLADEAGVVDMTVAAIHRITGIPVEILTVGIATLEAPDQGSRTPDMEGRRIVRMDEHREWGWFLVNFRKYRQMVSKEEKKEADRQRISAKRNGEKPKENSSVATCRKASRGVASGSEVSPTVADVAHAEAYPETDASKASASLRSASSSAEAADRSSGLVEKPEAGKPKLELTPPSDIGTAKAERLRQVTLDAIGAFNTALGKPNGLLPAVSLKVGIEKRQTQIKRSLRVARQICAELFKSPVITAEFWEAYFGQCAADEHKSGRLGGGPGHENWLPSFEYLTREDVMLALFDKATSEAAA